jgi:hypothetical protein
MMALSRPVVAWSVSDHVVVRVGTVRSACPVVVRGASDRCFAGARFSAIGASGHFEAARPVV